MAIRILVLPAHELWEPWIGRPRPDAEDRELPFRLLAARGIGWRRIDIHNWPWNPWARSHPLLRAIDPLRALRVLLFERDADIALCAFESSALLLLLLRRLFRSRIKVAVWDVGVAGRWRLRRWVLDRVVPRADALLPMGANQAAAIIARWSPKGIVQAMPMCMDCAFYRAAADCPQGPVLAIGDDISRDYLTLLEAVATLPHDVVLRTRLVTPQLADRAQLRVLPGMLDPPSYRDLIAGAAIVVLALHPSAHAGGVSVLVQAMASGKPLIVSASGGLDDYVRDGENCLVVPCHDPAALRAAIDRLLGDTALRITLGRQARAHVEAHASLEVEAGILEGVIRRLA